MSSETKNWKRIQELILSGKVSSGAEEPAGSVTGDSRPTNVSTTKIISSDKTTVMRTADTLGEDLSLAPRACLRCSHLKIGRYPKVPPVGKGFGSVCTINSSGTIHFVVSERLSEKHFVACSRKNWPELAVSSPDQVAKRSEQSFFVTTAEDCIDFEDGELPVCGHCLQPAQFWDARDGHWLCGPGACLRGVRSTAPEKPDVDVVK